MATYKKPASMAVSTFLDKPGWFHFLVNLIDEQPTKRDGGAIDGIRVECTCLGGTEASQEKRSFDPVLFNPSENHKDGGEFATRVHLRLADACCFPLPAAGEEVDIDWSKAKGSQIVALVKLSKGQDGKERLEIDGAHIYHVDDPDVKEIPKNQKMLALLPASKRRLSKDSNDARNQPAKPANKAGGTGKPAPTTPPTITTAPAAATFNPDDL